ncbi:MAG TPA: Abi family protein [Puia sp.]|nr:Abi family protein [Puia sp.]
MTSILLLLASPSADTLTFFYLENIEVAVKTQLSNIMGFVHGPHWYLDQNHFLTEQEKRQIQRNALFDGDLPKAFDQRRVEE